MVYLNRQGFKIAHKLSVQLSAAMREYPGTLAPQKIIDAPYFQGYGIKAELHYTALTAAGITHGFKDAFWRLADDADNLITTIPGWGCGFEIYVYADNAQEFVDIEFEQVNSEYIWAGLPESNLPHSILHPSYAGTGLLGVVNNIPYNNASASNVEIGCGRSAGSLEYGTDTTSPFGDFSGSVIYYEGAPGGFEDLLYRADVQQLGVDCFFQAHADGNGLQVTGEHITYGIIANARIYAAIAQHPAAYKYDIKERNGLNISGLHFSDVNGAIWVGGDSGWQNFGGRQTITASGASVNTGHTETVSPPFTSGGAWQIDDPVPDYIGGITCSDTDTFNEYTVTVRNPETGRETDYTSSRVMLYVPLGDSGDLEGSLNITFAQSANIDAFADDWQCSNGSFSGHTLIATDDCAISKSGFTRPAYPGEHGTLTAAELVPHMPLGNLVKVNGSNLNANTNYVLTINGKGLSWQYNSVSVTNSAITFDLTKPAAFRGADEAPKYMTEALPENYEGNEGDEDAPYYIDEQPLPWMLYGAVLYSSITIAGFGIGIYTLNSITSEFGDNHTYYFFEPEFAQVEKTGKQDIAGTEHPIERNRQGVIAKAGRFVEFVNNQKDTAPSGVTSWQFPRVAALEASAGAAAGARLFFPRDDAGAITIAAADRAQGGNVPPVQDLISEAAYIGWVFTDGAAVDAAPKIKPFVDLIEYAYYYNAAFNVYDCVIDIAGGWQGITGAGTVDIGGAMASSETQYMLKGQTTPADLKYKKSGNVIRQKAVETPPGYICRYCLRLLEIHGKILRNAAGKILRNAAGKILRGDFEV